MALKPIISLENLQSYDAKIKSYIDDKVEKVLFVGTKEEYDAAASAGKIDENTFSVITDEEEYESFLPIDIDEIGVLF